MCFCLYGIDGHGVFKSVSTKELDLITDCIRTGNVYTYNLQSFSKHDFGRKNKQDESKTPKQSFFSKKIGMKGKFSKKLDFRN